MALTAHDHHSPHSLHNTRTLHSPCHRSPYSPSQLPRPPQTQHTHSPTDQIYS